MSRKRESLRGADPRTLEAEKRGYPAAERLQLKRSKPRLRSFAAVSMCSISAPPRAAGASSPRSGWGPGRVLEIDLSEITQRFGPNVTVVQGDAFDVSSELWRRMALMTWCSATWRPARAAWKFQDQVASFGFSCALEVAGSSSSAEVLALRRQDLRRGPPGF